MTDPPPCANSSMQADSSTDEMLAEHVSEHVGRLVQLLLANWPRRGHTLLEVGCGDGVLLDLLWTLGFDVTGLDASAERLESARARVGARCELQLGASDALPWDDDAFDYVALLSVFMQPHDVTAVVHEAVRLARRGVIMIFPNSWSLAWNMTRLRHLRHPRKSQSPDCVAYSPWRMMRSARAACPAGTVIRLRSILPGSPATWAGGRVWSKINNWLLPVPLGTYVGLCLDMSPPIPLTGLPLLVTSSCLLPEASTVAPSRSDIAVSGTNEVSSVQDTREIALVHPESRA